ncbi:MAG: hypothetical protein ABI135_03225 [Rhodoferax sp.]
MSKKPKPQKPADEAMPATYFTRREPTTFHDRDVAPEGAPLADEVGRKALKPQPVSVRQERLEHLVNSYL